MESTAANSLTLTKQPWIEGERLLRGDAEQAYTIGTPGEWRSVEPTGLLHRPPASRAPSPVSGG